MAFSYLLPLRLEGRRPRRRNSVKSANELQLVLPPEPLLEHFEPGLSGWNQKTPVDTGAFGPIVAEAAKDMGRCAPWNGFPDRPRFLNGWSVATRVPCLISLCP